MVQKALGGINNFKKLLGDFNINKKSIGNNGYYSGNTINIGNIFSTIKRAVYVIIHEIGHLFDMRGHDPKKYWSEIFNQQFNQLDCHNPGPLGCLGYQTKWYYILINWFKSINSYNPSGETSGYGKTASIEDFADSFVDFVLITNDLSPYIGVDRNRINFIKAMIAVAVER